jgi:hypothetical protein
MWLRDLFARNRLSRTLLRGAPAAARIKVYSAGSGFAFEYFYKGHRSTGWVEEYIFQVSPGGGEAFDTCVELDTKALRAWEAEGHCPLSKVEQYGIVKLALFDAFDQRPTPEALRDPVPVGAPEIAALVERLGFA